MCLLKELLSFSVMSESLLAWTSGFLAVMHPARRWYCLGPKWTGSFPSFTNDVYSLVDAIILFGGSGISPGTRMAELQLWHLKALVSFNHLSLYLRVARLFFFSREKGMVVDLISSFLSAFHFSRGLISSHLSWQRWSNSVFWYLLAYHTR